MSKTIKGTGNDTVIVKNRIVTGALFAITLEHGTANTAVTNSMFDATKCLLKITLIRNGQSIQIVSDNLKILAAESSFFDGGWDVVMGTDNVELVAPAVGVFARRLLTYQFDLHSPIELEDKDQLKIQLTVNTGAYSAVLSAVNSQIEFSEIQSEGVEYGLPIVESYALNTGDSTHTVEPRDNVKQIVLVNLDKTDNLEASSVVSTKALTTDEIGITRQYLEIVSERTEQFSTMTEANARNQSHCLVKGDDLDKCSVELELVSSNVNAGKNYIVVRRMEVSASSVMRGEATREMKGMKKAQKIGVPVNENRLAGLRREQMNRRKG